MMADIEENISTECCRDYSALEFPAGLRILVVDDDLSYRLELEKMLRQFLYEVTTCERAKDALAVLQQDKNKFDIVLCDLHMPEMDGFQLLEMMELLDIDVPVVIMSVDDKKEVVMNSILKGACEYLEKPLRMDTVKFIWRHVIRKLKKGYKEAERSTESTVIGDIQMKQPIVADCVSTQHDGNSTAANSSKSLRRKKPDEDDNEVYDDVTTAKKPRVIWTVELHQKFIKAVNQIGHDKAVPKKILECMKEMNVTGLTRENVASHLQKYRLYLQKQNESLPENRSNIQQRSVTEVNSGQFAIPGLAFPEACAFEKLHVNSRVGIPLVDQRNLFRVPESSFCPVADFSNAGAVMAYNNISPPCEEQEYPYLGNLHEQHYQNLSTGDACELKGDYMYDAPEPWFFVKCFDQDETFRGPFP